jgi:hypothetical protein
MTYVNDSGTQYCNIHEGLQASIHDVDAGFQEPFPPFILFKINTELGIWFCFHKNIYISLSE